MHNILSKKVPDFVPVFLYAVIMLITQIKIIIYSEKWFNLVRRCLFFSFFLNAKNLGLSDDTKRRKKGWPNGAKCD